MKFLTRAPAFSVDVESIEDETVKTALRQLVENLKEFQRFLSLAINFNEITYISQNAAPTPEEGQIIVWKDADATAGQPKSYFITKQGGVTYTYRSVEVV